MQDNYNIKEQISNLEKKLENLKVEEDAVRDKLKVAEEQRKYYEKLIAEISKKFNRKIWQK